MKKCFISLISAGILFGCIWLSSCDKKNDDLTSDAVTDYLKLETGKYILYRYDSLRFTDYNRRDTMVTYQAKDVVQGPITDNLGRPGWRIVRYLRDWNSTKEVDWVGILTYVVTPSDQNIEMKEGNFRYIKLIKPIKDGASWHGNGFLPDKPYAEFYEFSNDQDIQNWDYTYSDVGASLTINNKNYDSTIAVTQIADSSNLPITGDAAASKSLWVEKYARGIGLVYKEVAVWEFQPGNNGQTAYRQGFGITMSILDHN
ncbi:MULTISPECIES: hypothetical protein [Niastella]|uniref:Uncharacterized protein n=1 Tax=Niastella soli TaxID=2821487 RepID=A0ABS3YUB6_9BACT|nr:hypothetical protein [Niastella soli]MBO9201509.1 hypothetical protein [Niastella soli]